MARNRGTANYSANLEVKKAGPLDARTIVGSLADLITGSTWLYDDNSEFTYEGMLVSVTGETTESNNGLYRLKAKPYSDPANWTMVGTGVGVGTLAIEDEGGEILSGVTVINFIGANVNAMSAIDGLIRRVNVYIPPPAYVSYFNAGSATVSSISTTSRNVASPTSEGSPYKIGGWVGGSTQNTIRNSISPLVYSTAANFGILNLLTTFTAIVYDADGTTPLATNTISLTGNVVTTASSITITVTSWGSNADRYQADISVSIAIGTILPNGGRFSVKLTHYNSTDGTYTFTQNNVYRDTENLTASIAGTLTVVPSTPVTKQISGVYFYTTNSTWHVNLTNINNLNSRSYPATQLTIDDTNLFIPTTISGGGTGFFSGTTWTTYHDTTGAIYDKTDWTTSTANSTNWTGSGINANSATATAYDWASVGSVSSVGYNYLIDTYTDSSDRNTEMFRTESNGAFSRLQSNLSTPWDSTASLSVTNGGTGLQIIGDRLVYPQYSFTGYLPNSGSQPTYVGLSGDRYYYRRFNTNGSYISNGVIVFADYNVVEADLSAGNVKFEISIDNGTSWYNLNASYIGGVLSNGSGCRTNSAEYGLPSGTITPNSLQFTLGSGGASLYIHLKITFKSAASSKYIGTIDITTGNWI